MAALRIPSVLLLAASAICSAAQPQPESTAGRPTCSDSGEECDEAGFLQVPSRARRNDTTKIAIFTTGGAERLACGCPDPTASRCGIGRRDDNRTLQMAMAVQEGAREYCAGKCQVDLFDIRMEGQCPEYPEVSTYDAIILGSAVWQGLPTPDMVEYTSLWSRKGQRMACKVGAAFASGEAVYGGLQETIHALHVRLQTFQMIIVGGPDWTVNPGAAAVTGAGAYQTDKGDSSSVGGDPTWDEDTFKPVDDMFLNDGKGLGYRVATVATAAKQAGLTDGSLCKAYPGVGESH